MSTPTPRRASSDPLVPDHVGTVGDEQDPFRWNVFNLGDCDFHVEVDPTLPDDRFLFDGVEFTIARGERPNAATFDDPEPEPAPTPSYPSGDLRFSCPAHGLSGARYHVFSAHVEEFHRCDLPEFWSYEETEYGTVAGASLSDGSRVFMSMEAAPAHH